MIRKLFRLVIAVLLCEAAGIVGGIFTAQSVKTWYVTLEKPFFNPPSWLFGPAWTLLYLMMGISLYLVWTAKAKAGSKRLAVAAFAVQLALNALWSFIFFGMKAPLAAFIELAVLWVFILLTMIAFKPISRTAAWLLLPYILWVSFAGVLNLSVHLLNP
jgi:benzodiazapine receptor